MKRRRAPETPYGDLALVCWSEADRANVFRWPSPKYRESPEKFFEEILGVRPWEKQREILNAVRDHTRVSVRSGHKVSKSHSAAGIALWFYSSFDDARVVMTATTARQVDKILWRETRMMLARSGRCLTCKLQDPNGSRPCPHSALIDGEKDVGQRASTGLKSDDFREIVGFTAKEAEAVAGISGKNLLYIGDEASGIPEVIFEAIEGNRAGGARVLYLSNPTRTEGEFYESQTSKKLEIASDGTKKGFYFCIHVSSEDSPNVREGREVVPGLATPEWVAEKAEEWGVDSPLYKIRVKGEFVENEDGKICTVHALTRAEEAWADHAEAVKAGEAEEPSDPLHLGVDPAGPGLAGDETSMTPRRGLKVYPLHVFRGLSEDGIVTNILGVLKEHRRPRDAKPVVKIDREGPIGSKLLGLLRAYVDLNPEAFTLVAVRSSDKARRERANYDRVRDELWARMAEWIREGGMLPPDNKLTKDLHGPSWETQLNGKLKATGKDELKKLLGRSPDRGDSTCLAVWEDAAVPDDGGGDAVGGGSSGGGGGAVAPDAYEPDDAPSDATFDPYGGAN